MTYMIKRDGQESGPFTLEAMKEMHATGKIAADVLFRRYGTDHWMASVDLESELNAPIDPPALPAEPQPLGFKKSVKVWGMTLGGLFAVGLLLKLFQPPGPSPEMLAIEAKRKEEASAYRAEVSQMIDLGGRLGRKDGASVGSGGGRKPSLNEITMLCAKRATENGVEKTSDEAMQNFARAYIDQFKKSYKSTADW